MQKSAHSQGRNNPSFSSSLLDSIYRSIDESNARSPIPSLSSASKLQIPSVDRKWIPTPPVNHRQISSSCSSLGGFSSSASIRSRTRDPRAPASPGSRLAAFLNVIFAGGGRNSKKPKFAGGQEESARSRSGKQRSVRFSPASIAAVEEKRRSGEVPMVRRDRRTVLEELMRGCEMGEEEEESDCESVSSSELFELESLSAIGRFRDELPVYETTNIHANRAVAHGFMV